MDLTRRDFVQTGAALMAAQGIGRTANDRITVGFIGTGARGQELIQAVQKHPQAEITGLCDAYTGRIERALDRTNGRPKAYKTHHDLLAQKSIDCVVVATPDHLHKQIVLDALRAGKDVYCEKPLTYSSAEGLEIVHTARDRKRMVQVGSQGMSSALEQKAREKIRAGWLGAVTTIRAAYNRNTVSGAWIYPVPPDASPKTVNWEMFLGSAPKRPFSLERFFRWRCYQDYSGGIATDLFVHLCTTIHYLMDVAMPTRVIALGELYRWSASRDVPDTLNAILEYPKSFVVNLSATFNNQLNSEGSFQILGTEGSLILDSRGLTFEPEEVVEDNRWIVESWPKALEDAYYRNPNVIVTEIEARQELQRKKQREKEEEEKEGKEDRDERFRIKESGPDATVAHFGHFFDSVRTRQPYWEDALAGHHAAACAHMVNLSAKERRLVEWDFARDDIRGS
jgi:predicted dehydrogenase